MRASLPDSPQGHFTWRVQYGFQKNSGSYMKCQPFRWVARRNGLASEASWNCVKVSETVMINVSFRATEGRPLAGTTVGAPVAAGADVGAGADAWGGAAVAAWPVARRAAGGFAPTPVVGAAPWART